MLDEHNDEITLTKRHYLHCRYEPCKKSGWCHHHILSRSLHHLQVKSSPLPQRTKGTKRHSDASYNNMLIRDDQWLPRIASTNTVIESRETVYLTVKTELRRPFICLHSKYLLDPPLSCKDYVLIGIINRKTLPFFDKEMSCVHLYKMTLSRSWQIQIRSEAFSCPKWLITERLVPFRNINEVSIIVSVYVRTKFD